MTKKRQSGDLWKIGFLLAFILCIVSLTNMETLRRSGVNSDFFGILATFAAAMITVTLPNYMARMIEAPEKHYKKIRFLSVGAGLLSFLIIVFSLFQYTYKVNLIALGITISLMVIAILYSMVLLSRGRRRGSGNHKINPYGKIMQVFVIFMIPLMVYFDFIRTEAQFYIVLPVMYIGINILMILEELTEFPDGKNVPLLDCEKMKNAGLTTREQEVAVLLVQGQTYRKIGDQLCISLETVKTHVSKIYSKAGSGNKMELLQKLGS